MRSVNYEIICPKCKEIAGYNVYHSVHDDNVILAKIFNDELNKVTCIKCGNQFQVNTHLMFISHKHKSCIIYDPHGDFFNSDELTQVKEMLGDQSIFNNAIHVSEWSVFKDKIDMIINPAINKSKNSNFLSSYYSNYAEPITTWHCEICDGDETTGCLYFDPTECPR